MPRDDHIEITPDLLLQAYASGVFPMADNRDDPDLFWVDPDRRGVLPLNGLRLSRSLRRAIRRDRFDISFDRAFDAVVAACAERTETWISARIEGLYGELHRRGAAHSVEVWDADRLVGGAYGVALGGAFFGESMFSTVTDASKIALAHLVVRLLDGGFALLDTQFQTHHLASLGVVEVPRAQYHALLARALRMPARFDAAAPVPSGQEVVQRITQTS